MLGENIMNVIKIVRGDVHAEVLERYLADFIKDGWSREENEVKEPEEPKKDKTIHLNK